MNLSTTLALTVCAGVVAYVAGHRTQREAIPEVAAPETLRPASLTRPQPGQGSRDATAVAAVRAMGKYAAYPGQNYDAISELFNILTNEDPARTARWASQLPYSTANDRVVTSDPARWAGLRDLRALAR